MNDLEERIREELAGEVDRFRHRDRQLLGPPLLAPGVRKRVRRRQLGTMLASVVAVAGLTLGSIAGVRWLDADTGHAPAFRPATNPSPQPTSFAPKGWPVMTFTDPQGPYIDHDPWEDVYLDGPKQALAAGTVTYGDVTVRWSFVVYRTKDSIDYSKVPDNNRSTVESTDTPSSFCEEFWVVDHNGVGGGDSGCWDRHGGSGFSSHPGSLDIEFGYGGLPGSDTGSYFESDGFVSSEVARLEARLDTADVQEIPLMPGPAGTDMSIYVFFAPLGATGTVVAYDENGNIVQTQPFCATAPAGESGSEGSSFGGGGTATGTTTRSGTATASGSGKATSRSSGSNAVGRGTTPAGSSATGGGGPGC